MLFRGSPVVIPLGGGRRARRPPGSAWESFRKCAQCTLKCTLSRGISRPYRGHERNQIPALLGYRGQPVAVVAMHVLGDVTGTLAFLMPEPQARNFSAWLCGRSTESAELDTLARSSLMETANILGGAYVGALAALMGRLVMLSVPTYGIEPPDRVLERQRAASTREQVALCIETTLSVDDCAADYGGHIVLLPDGPALRLLLESLPGGERAS